MSKSSNNKARSHNNTAGSNDLGMEVYPSFLLLIAFVGIVNNVISLLVFMRQRFRKNFHRLLIILASYDLLVSCAIQIEMFS